MSRNSPPEGIDPSLLEADELQDDTSDEDVTMRSAHNQKLKEVLATATQAFISVSRDAPTLDYSYLQERSRVYAANIKESEWLPSHLLPGTVISLGPGPWSASAADSAVTKALGKVSNVVDDTAGGDHEMSRQLAKALVNEADCKIDSKREVLTPVE